MIRPERRHDILLMDALKKGDVFGRGDVNYFVELTIEMTMVSIAILV